MTPLAQPDRPAANETRGEESGDVDVALDQPCSSKLHRGIMRRVWAPVQKFCRVTMGVASKHPSLLIVPIVLYCILVGVAVWAAVSAEKTAQHQLREQAHTLAVPIGDAIQLQFESPSFVIWSVATAARATPSFPDLVPALDRIAEDTLKTGSVMGFGVAPLGILEYAYPPSLKALLTNNPQLDQDLMRGLFINISTGYKNVDVSKGSSPADWIPQPQLTKLIVEYTATGYIAVALVTIPVFVPKGTAVNYNRTQPMINCSLCEDPTADQEFWGLAFAAIEFSKFFLVSSDDPLLRQLRQGNYDFRATILYQQALGAGPPNFAQSSTLPEDPECVRHTIVIAEWELCIAPNGGWRRPWLSPVIAAIVIVSAVVCVLLFMMMLSRLRHQMLLQSLVPKQVLKQMQEDTTFLQAPPAKPLLQAGTAADRILSLMDELLAGQEPDQTSLLLIRNAVLRSKNIYLPLDFGRDLKAHAYDTDVTAALMRQLGTGGRPISFDDGRSSTTMLADCVSLSEPSGTAGTYAHTSKFSTLAGGLGAILGVGKGNPTDLLRDAHLDRAGSAYSSNSSSLAGTPDLRPTSAAALGALGLTLNGSTRSAARLGATRKLSSPGFADSANGHTGSLTQLPSSEVVPAGPRSYELDANGGSTTAGVVITIPRPLMDQVETLLNAASNDFHFDAFALADATHGRPLSALAFFLFHNSGLVTHFKLQGSVLARFLMTCEDGYRPNPYHNATHAADVLQTYHVMLTKGGMVPGYADPVTLMACYIAAVVHDYEHVGLTNDFLINSSDTLAILYNDRTPMENHHVAAAFNLLRQADCAFLIRMPKNDMDKIRKLVIDLVLGTDMKQHFSLIAQFTTVHRVATATPGGPLASVPPSAADSMRISRRSPPLAKIESPSPAELSTTGKVNHHQPIDDAERLLTLQIALKCADLGHICEGLEVHLRWVALLETEFFAQGDKEKELGLPISPLFDRTKPGVTKSQVGFFSFVVLPLFQAFSRVFPGVRPALESTQANFAYWEAEARTSK